MTLDDCYYYFIAQISEEICNDIIKQGVDNNLVKGTVYPLDDNNTEDTQPDIEEKTRTSKVSFLSDKWIYDIIHPLIAEANQKSSWNFEYSNTEPMQFTQYGLNEFYNWHHDSAPHPFRDVHPNFNGKIRKLSSIINLSKPGDYEGGNLEFDFRNLSEKSSNIRVCNEIKEQGSIVIFPSFIYHRVTPITKGTRHSLVSWTVGYPWK